MENFKDYQDLIKFYFERWIAESRVENKKEFARSLGISPSTLSEMMSGRHLPSLKTINKVSDALGLNEEERGLFLDLVRSKDTSNPELKEYAIKQIEKRSQKANYKMISGSEFSDISKWYYLAILDYLKLPNAARTTQNISCKTGLKIEIVEKVLSKLRELSFVRKMGNYYYATERPVMVDSSDNISKSIQTYHNENLAIARERLRVSPELREYSSNHLYLTEDELKRIKDDLRYYRRKMQRVYSASDSDKNQKMYTLGIYLFPTFDSGSDD